MTGDPVLITGVGRRATAFVQFGVPVTGAIRARYLRLGERGTPGAERQHCKFDRRMDVNVVIPAVPARHPVAYPLASRCVTGRILPPDGGRHPR